MATSKKKSRVAQPKVHNVKKEYSLLENAFRVLSRTQESVQKYEEFREVLDKTEEVINKIDETFSTIE